jgi:glutathione peroxidase-family protein
MISHVRLPLLPGAAQANYEGISALGAQFKGKPFRVLAFPDDQYLGQEPGTNAEIKEYVSGSGTHSYPGHPKATWSGTAVRGTETLFTGLPRTVPRAQPLATAPLCLPCLSTSSQGQPPPDPLWPAARLCAAYRTVLYPSRRDVIVHAQVPPAILMAKTNGYSGPNPKPPPWAPGLKGQWCNVTSSTACAPSSAECCAKNAVVWKWLEKTVPSVPACKGSYPPSWNFAGKYLIDQCGKLVGAAGNSASEPWTTVAPMVAKLLATTPKC